MLTNAKVFKFVRYRSLTEMYSAVVLADNPFCLKYTMNKTTKAMPIESQKGFLSAYLFAFNINYKAHRTQYKSMMTWYSTNLDTFSSRSGGDKLALLLCDAELGEQVYVPSYTAGISDNPDIEKKWFTDAWEKGESLTKHGDKFVVHDNQNSVFAFAYSITPRKLIFLTPPLPKVTFNSNHKNFAVLKDRLNSLKRTIYPLYQKGEI